MPLRISGKEEAGHLQAAPRSPEIISTQPWIKRLHGLLYKETGQERLNILDGKMQHSIFPSSSSSPKVNASRNSTSNQSCQFDWCQKLRSSHGLIINSEAQKGNINIDLSVHSLYSLFIHLHRLAIATRN